MCYLSGHQRLGDNSAKRNNHEKIHKYITISESQQHVHRSKKTHLISIKQKDNDETIWWKSSKTAKLRLKQLTVHSPIFIELISFTWRTNEKCFMTSKFRSTNNRKSKRILSFYGMPSPFSFPFPGKMGLNFAEIDRTCLRRSKTISLAHMNKWKGTEC